jgi:hypothetical protein
MKQKTFRYCTTLQYWKKVALETPVADVLMRHEI